MLLDARQGLDDAYLPAEIDNRSNGDMEMETQEGNVDHGQLQQRYSYSDFSHNRIIPGAIQQDVGGVDK
ncbi:unnamed protein product [Absidia cylindrospora]